MDSIRAGWHAGECAAEPRSVWTEGAYVPTQSKACCSFWFVNVHWVASSWIGAGLAILAKWLIIIYVPRLVAMVVELHFPLCPLPWGVGSGSQLLSWTQDTVIAIPPTSPAPPPKRKYSLLPVLIVLFLISYGLMCMLAVEQDRTISSQRWLIRSLLSDSSELSSMKGKLVQKQYADAQAQAKAGSRSGVQTPLTQVPSTQVPMTQVPMNQVPMNQDKAGSAAQSSHNASKARKAMPPKPPLGISDVVDGRRIVKTI